MKTRTTIEYLAILLAILTSSANGQYSDLLEMTLPFDSLDVEFSGDHRFIGVGQEAGLYVYHGHTGKFRQRILVP